MKVYDVCLHVGNGGEWLGDFYIKIKKQLEDSGLSVILYTDVAEIKNVFIENSIDDFIFLEKYSGKIDADWAMKFLTELDFNPRSLYNSEQKFYDLAEKDCIEYFAGMVHSVYLLRNRPKAKYYITYEGDELDHNVFRILGRINKGKFIYWGYSNLNTRLHFHDTEKRYSKTPFENITVVPEIEVEWIQNYIKTYTEKKTNQWGDPKRVDVKFKITYFKVAFRKLLISVFGDEVDPRKRFGHAFKSYFKRIIRRQYAFTKYTSNFLFDDSVDYYYFPLHVPFDSQLTQRGLPFYDQVSLIQTISNYLPYSAKLIVKEHPMGRGYYSISDINKLSKIPNVILLPAYSNSHDLIPKAKAIFVINSSVGYEGLMYNKTVVTFGRSLFRKQGLTIDIDSLYELENVFNNIEKHQICREDVIKFLWRIKSNTYPVDLYFLNKNNYIDKGVEFSKAILNELQNRL
jgi:hypothetical protein